METDWLRRMRKNNSVKPSKTEFSIKKKVVYSLFFLRGGGVQENTKEPDEKKTKKNSVKLGKTR